MNVRRVGVLASWCLVALVAASSAGAQAKTAKAAPPPPTQVRMSWQTFISGPGGAQRLASLTKAVAKMRSLDTSPPNSADYRRSWAYWANIHGYYGAKSPDGTVAQQVQYLTDSGFKAYVKYYKTIKDQNPPDSIALAIWATCQHSGDTQALNFFGWHRMYVYYFERVLRWAANDSTLRLPYWDYTDTTNLALPAEFRKTTSPLYTSLRRPGINAGTSTLSKNSTNITNLLPDTSYFDYESQIEEGIHGYVHCTVGPTCPVAYMGDVPVAGNDPIFYSHHANIDRIWACWQKLHGTPAGSWQSQKFSFVDETGTLQTKPVSFVVNSTTLGYTYDHETNCGRAGAPVLIANAATGVKQDTTKALIHSAKSIVIREPLVTIDVTPPQKTQLLGALGNLEKAGALQLVLKDITADGAPGVLFDVYLAKKGNAASRQHVGTISWFGAFGTRHGKRGPVKKTMAFDVTAQVKALGGRSLADSGLSVIIEATDGTTPTDPTKVSAHQAEVKAAFRKEANLKIGAVELRGGTAPPRS